MLLRLLESAAIVEIAACKEISAFGGPPGVIHAPASQVVHLIRLIRNLAVISADIPVHPVVGFEPCNQVRPFNLDTHLAQSAGDGCQLLSVVQIVWASD